MLTLKQQEFLLEFFKNEYAGWRNIATILLTSGECTVAGEKCIWRGGVGNFIKTEIAEGYFGCLKYTFNLKEFISSQYFLEHYHNTLNDLSIQKINIQNKVNELKSLILIDIC
jgi:hypothetical protein